MGVQAVNFTGPRQRIVRNAGRTLAMTAFTVVDPQPTNRITLLYPKPNPSFQLDIRDNPFELDLPGYIDLDEAAAVVDLSAAHSYALIVGLRLSIEVLTHLAARVELDGTEILGWTPLNVNTHVLPFTGITLLHGHLRVFLRGHFATPGGFVRNVRVESYELDVLR